jgi:hypothetical protein
MAESIPNSPFEAKIQHLEKFDEETLGHSFQSLLVPKNENPKAVIPLS